MPSSLLPFIQQASTHLASVRRSVVALLLHQSNAMKLSLLFFLQTSLLVTPALAFQPAPFHGGVRGVAVVARGVPSSSVAVTSSSANYNNYAVVSTLSAINNDNSNNNPSKSALRMSETADAGGESTSTSSGGTASIPNEIFNLVKSIVGAGVLSLPAVCSDDYYDELVYQNCAREMKRAYRRSQKVVICVVSFASEERN
eukprot:scaffold2347_cov208-Alexandrium_tamarense.AAC.6